MYTLGKNFCRATASSQIQPVLGGKHSVLNAQVLRAKHVGGPGGLLGFGGLLVVVAVRAVVMVVAVLSDCLGPHAETLFGFLPCRSTL